MFAETLGGINKDDALFGDDVFDVGVSGLGIKLRFDPR